ncbi:uncharacterized protein EDB93DRAFT_1104921 [Suillus bovinus]|uniref:uncharacterized protein n=1 Tax=Suillus bovinus TaxID=48563 RepID=UPI001B862A65|nr:uncharacterized protein EDB93DRAFT_1104921 [Suillus bovinus]KAG2144715.1 hypothetical protein EDB93DRAFT_1104921 [Suillus bovinus]
MPPTANTKQSTRYWPDLSDTSLSFQIPVDSSSAEFLLADHSSDLDFLHGAGAASFATIAPTPARGQLQISDVTPQVTSQLLSRSPSPSLSDIALDAPAVSEDRLESLRAELGTLKDDYDIPMQVQPLVVARSVSNVTAAPHSKLKPRTRINSAVEGGRNTNLATHSRIPMSTADKLGPTSIAEPTVQSSSTWISESENVAIDTEFQVPPAGLYLARVLLFFFHSFYILVIAIGNYGSISHDLRRPVLEMPSLVFPSIYNPRTESSFTAGTGTGVARTEERVETQPSPAVDIVDAPSSPDASSRNDYLLRLSEISPQKHHSQASASPGHLSTGRRELSPMRPARKRPATEEHTASQRPSGSKKVKAKPLASSAEAKSGPTVLAGSSTRVLRTSTQKNHPHASTTLISRNSRCPTSNFPSARTKYKPRQNFQRQVRSTLIASSSLRSQTICKGQDKNIQGQEGVSTSHSVVQSRTSGSSRVSLDAKYVVSKQPTAITALEQSGSSRPSLVPPFEQFEPSRPGCVSPLEKASITLPPANITKPIAFTFHVDARIEARKAEFEKPAGSASERVYMEKGHQQRHAVPDFKVLHEVHQTSLGWRKEHVVPIVPAPPIILNTEIRAREREKFDRMVRIKEEEIQRAKEERRRQRDAEEEREIKELRKRAIPRANEIPEWYADMPKKGGVGGSG